MHKVISDFGVIKNDEIVKSCLNNLNRHTLGFFIMMAVSREGLNQ